MEDLFKCPICCNETFDSKESLLQHISDILENLYCPVCKNKWSTLERLIKHLTLDNCQKKESNTIIFENELQDSIHIEDTNESNDDKVELTNDKVEIEIMNKVNQEQFGSVYSPDTSVVTGEVNKMYVELLSKQLTKPCLQKQELKLVNENGENHYVIITQPSSELDEFTVVTKQNNDGTISLTTVNDVKLESENGPALTHTENEVDDSQEEMYTCNTCGVSFSSVLEHIQNYHNDQVVVVEDEAENDHESDIINNEDIDSSYDKQTPRRVITDTGDIVEAPIGDEVPDLLQDPKDPVKTTKEGSGKQSRVTTTHYVQIENLCNSVVKDIKPNKSVDNLAYHKVVVKKMKVQNGTSVNMYHCKSCDIYAASLEDLRMRPCKSPLYACPHCSSVYENSKSLCMHMKEFHKNPDKVPEVPTSYECELCSTVFPTNKSLKLHKRMHDPLKTRPIELPVENKDGTEVSKKIYRCQICDKVIPIDYRQVHQNSHTNTDRFHCDVCNKKFTSSEYLKMHMSVHNLDKVPVNEQDKSLPYNCSYCNRRFARPHEKVKHERIHTGEKPHSCDICGKSFRVSYCLTLHMRTHTGARPYACNYCGKRFKAHSVYNHHLLTHSDVRAYKCPYCPKAFKTSVQLAGHKNSHTKPFSCQHCNRPFASLYAVRVHTETHARQNNLKFSCSMCGASYARAFALKDHIRQAHNTKVEPGMNSNELIVP